MDKRIAALPLLQPYSSSAAVGQQEAELPARKPRSGCAGMFWVHYRRKADGQDFHERLTVKGLLDLLARGGIALCDLETAERRRDKFEDRAQI